MKVSEYHELGRKAHGARYGKQVIPMISKGRKVTINGDQRREVTRDKDGDPDVQFVSNKKSKRGGKLVAVEVVNMQYMGYEVLPVEATEAFQSTLSWK